MAMTHAGQIAAAYRAGFRALVGAWLRAATGRMARSGPTSAARAAGAPIGPAERVVTVGCDVEGSLVVATGLAVYWQDAPVPSRAWSRLGWEDVAGVDWDELRCVLTLTGVRPGRASRKELALPSHTALVELARERLTATLLARTAVRHGDQVCAWVTARRQPGSGKVIWVAVLNGAADVSESAILAKVDAAIADLQAQTGITAAAWRASDGGGHRDGWLWPSARLSLGTGPSRRRCRGLVLPARHAAPGQRGRLWVCKQCQPSAIWPNGLSS